MKFAEIVRSHGPLRATFERVSGLAFWWRVVLALHGKPVATALPEHERIAVLVHGFRFYGGLYLGLGLVLLAVAAGALLIDVGQGSFWPILFAVGAVYLVACSRLAFEGARRFGSGHREGAALLVTFFVCVMVFLAAFGAYFSMWVHGRASVPDLANVVLFSAFVLFGIGSYLIEVLYLVWWNRRGDV